MWTAACVPYILSHHSKNVLSMKIIPIFPLPISQSADTQRLSMRQTSLQNDIAEVDVDIE